MCFHVDMISGESNHHGIHYLSVTSSTHGYKHMVITIGNNVSHPERRILQVEQDAVLEPDKVGI